MNANFKKYILILILSLPILPAAAEIMVEITPIGLGDGMAQLEAMVNNETADAAEEIKNLIGTYTLKPLLFEAMSVSGTTTASILPFSFPVLNDYAVFSGSAASFTTSNFNIQELTAQLSDFAIEDDIYIGAALQAFSLYMTLPADFLIEDLSFTAGLGYLSFNYDIANIGGSNLHLSSSYTFFDDDSDEVIKWTGLNLQAGFSLSGNSIAVVYPIENITQTFPIDPDGDGPIVPFFVTISLSPEVSITYRNTQFSIPASISTGIKIIDTFSISIGTGAAVTFGQNEIDISVDDEITVEGFLSDLIEISPHIIVSGSEPGAVAELLAPFVFAALSFNTGNFYLSIPVSWNFSDTITAGISLGAGF